MDGRTDDMKRETQRIPFAISYLNCSVSDSFSVRAQDGFASKFNNIFSRFYCRFKNYWLPRKTEKYPLHTPIRSPSHEAPFKVSNGGGSQSYSQWGIPREIHLTILWHNYLIPYCVGIHLDPSPFRPSSQLAFLLPNSDVEIYLILHILLLLLLMIWITNHHVDVYSHSCTKGNKLCHTPIRRLISQRNLLKSFCT